MKCLVTGGAGFIGSNLVDRLLSMENEVIVLDNFSNGKWKNLPHNKNKSQLLIIRNDITSDYIKSFLPVDTVFHLAALPRVQYSIKNPLETNDVNVNGTLNLLELSKEKGVKRFVYSASSSAYGDQDTLPLNETMIPNPMSPYAAQKLFGEYYCKIYHDLYGLETISLRYFNVYGQRHDPSGGYACLIPKSIDKVLSGVSPEIYGDGENTRDFTYVSDVVDANIKASLTQNQKAFGEVFNIGTQRNVSVNYVVNSIIGSSGIKPIYKDSVIEPKHTLADISKAKEILEWHPNYSFEKGIEETIQYFKDNKS